MRERNLKTVLRQTLSHLFKLLHCGFFYEQTLGIRDQEHCILEWVYTDIFIEQYKPSYDCNPTISCFHEPYAVICTGTETQAMMKQLICVFVCYWRCWNGYRHEKEKVECTFNESTVWPISFIRTIFISFYFTLWDNSFGWGYSMGMYISTTYICLYIATVYPVYSQIPGYCDHPILYNCEVIFWQSHYLCVVTGIAPEPSLGAVVLSEWLYQTSFS